MNCPILSNKRNANKIKKSTLSFRLSKGCKKKQKVLSPIRMDMNFPEDLLLIMIILQLYHSSNRDDNHSQNQAGDRKPE